ncbi:hypothetical protein SDC9_155173 [bioreactor metagenome]|uniref:Uncharacterized protein n=1 Tax=bioreactor metagenome TaxID=1076179 RepID=A0A645F0U5_9ZZZZ
MARIAVEQLLQLQNKMVDRDLPVETGADREHRPLRRFEQCSDVVGIMGRLPFVEDDVNKEAVDPLRKRLPDLRLPVRSRGA